MNLIACILLTIIGGAMLVMPKKVWIISDSWKVKTKAEPTSLYLILIRIGGSILIIGGISAILLFRS
ncbi:DUF6199 family natural product biosynthesis protein [Inconstantimicrobium mannanitabidum]|uniref:Uncharacterized protein n=1 Tax=Inconstantimicrobium mannanitabidum TaxID=1604901 RepID=A0ACB5REX6_9CLOT|nr:DUF6199 family natural product biosynthesis protein [Clostridium sp. TW13]GKX67655.1 hypothetical protein rsdtw13_29130 [Clostridium sp. TW13]